MPELEMSPAVETPVMPEVAPAAPEMAPEVAPGATPVAPESAPVEVMA